MEGSKEAIFELEKDMAPGPLTFIEELEGNKGKPFAQSGLFRDINGGTWWNPGLVGLSSKSCTLWWNQAKSQKPLEVDYYAQQSIDEGVDLLSLESVRRVKSFRRDNNIVSITLDHLNQLKIMINMRVCQIINSTVEEAVLRKA